MIAITRFPQSIKSTLFEIFSSYFSIRKHFQNVDFFFFGFEANSAASLNCSFTEISPFLEFLSHCDNTDCVGVGRIYSKRFAIIPDTTTNDGETPPPKAAHFF